MRKLSIEQKAQRYDEAVGVCRKLYNKAKANGYTSLSEVYEQIFPALKESEDEMIRKDIVEAVELHKDFTQERKEYIYAWLEKQGEQKKTPIEGEFPYDNPSDTLEGEIENIWRKLSSGDRFSATKEGFREVITHFVNYIKEQDDCELVEQKLAQWDLLDVRAASLIRDAINGMKLTDEARFIALNWLKSLKERYTWKPSDEQVKALQTAIGIVGELTPTASLLKEIREQLKKLK